MLITLKGLDGSVVIVNSFHILFISQAGDERKNPILGASAIAFEGGTVLAVKGSPAEIAEMLGSAGATFREQCN